MQVMYSSDQLTLMLRIIDEALAGNLDSGERADAIEMAAYLRWRYTRLWGPVPPSPSVGEVIGELAAQLAAGGVTETRKPSGEARPNPTRTERAARRAAREEEKNEEAWRKLNAREDAAREWP